MIEFWKFSSRTQPRHRQHPRTAVIREAVLIHWKAGWTEEAIAFRLDIDVWTVHRHLREARKAKDARAVIRHAGTLQAMEMAK